MLDFSYNPLLQGNRYSTTLDKGFKLKSKVSLNTAVLSLFTLTVVSYLSFWFFCNELFENNATTAISDIKNFSLVSGVLSFSIAFLAYYKPTLSPLLAPLYSIFSGIFIAGISFAAEIKFPGIALLTSEITLATFIIVFVGYKFKIIRVTQKFKSVVYSVIGVISLLYLLSFILILFEIKMPLIHDAGIGGIAWALFIMIIAASNLAINIDKVQRSNSNDGYTNWRLALGLMVSLIWLYFSTLRLLSRINKFK